jgi:hypothetical protein
VPLIGIKPRGLGIEHDFTHRHALVAGSIRRINAAVSAL